MDAVKHLYLDFRKNSEKLDEKIRQLKKLYPDALFPSLSIEDDVLTYFIQNVFSEGLLSPYYICNTSLKAEKLDFTIQPKIDGPRLQNEFPCSMVLCVRGHPSPLGHDRPYVVINRIIDISGSEKKSFEAEASVSPYWSEEKVHRNRRDNNILDYDFILSLPEISKETQKNLIKWKDYLKWKREIIKNNLVVLKYIQVDLIDDELHFYVVTRDESTFKALRRILSRNELGAFPLNYSTDNWNFIYKDLPKSERQSRFASIGEFKYARPHDSNPEREIDCPWDDFLVMNAVFELDEEDQSVFEEYADTYYDTIRSNIGDDRYWLKIYDQNTGQVIYRSHLATLIDIPEPTSGSSATISVIIPRGKIHLGQDRRNEVTFRIRDSKIVFNAKTFLVRVGRPMEKLEEEIWDIVIGVVSGLAFSVLLLMAISYFVAGYILKPVRIINDQARDITEKHLDLRIPVSGDWDEFNALAQTLNQVFDRLQHAFLRQKRLLADASHELKTPLTMMRLALAEICPVNEVNPPGPQAESLALLTEQVLRMERLVKNILDLSSLGIEGTTTKEPIDVVKMLTSLIADYRFVADTRNIQIDARLPNQLIVKGNAEKLNRAFSNILDNAIKYNVDNGRIEVVADQSGVDLTIIVTNTGPGVSETEIDKVFDQFYRVEKSRSLQHSGSGLGLAIVKRIVELHRGKVKLESKQGTWTRITVCLPRHRETISL